MANGKGWYTEALGTIRDGCSWLQCVFSWFICLLYLSVTKSGVRCELEKDHKSTAQYGFRTELENCCVNLVLKHLIERGCMLLSTLYVVSCRTNFFKLNCCRFSFRNRISRMATVGWSAGSWLVIITSFLLSLKIWPSRNTPTWSSHCSHALCDWACPQWTWTLRAELVPGLYASFYQCKDHVL